MKDSQAKYEFNVYSSKSFVHSASIDRTTFLVLFFYKLGTQSLGDAFFVQPEKINKYWQNVLIR